MENLRHQILHYGRLMIERGLVSGTGGNISCRLPEGDQMLVTPSQMAYDQLTPEDLVIVDILSGDVLEGARRPSIEQGLHRAIYRARPDVKAIIHTHSRHATAVASTRKDIPPFLDNMVVNFGGGVRTAAHAPIGTPELAEYTVRALGDAPVALLANHGGVAVGKDLAQAFSLAEFLEECAMVYLLSFLAGGPVTLAPEVVERERAWLQGRYGQR
ncbi:l-ribulose-5-phosphate 4-epimerase, putative [Heliomicrobium modesticaldum Ice1]|uniref:L-ribulose-5-phosphate 4-epimerase, putative n=1 Tax=Heliobacterium modesticaldum (strain ATCC 51547 / Ice1) TaxID=498761 RepID=B0TEP3_HELMI|nr:class II aldolase/adducin family protein [Heliomicrobium modesticaldum]ABZ84295.1 l-ribulose-5-phosphate 4-epimerase, putative [Heliomicrobium modesticaldum Ice1]